MVNIVTSSDPRLGAVLSEDPRVDMVSFTGSTATGTAVMTAAAATIKKVFLELGGKSAFLVLDGADLDRACGAAAVAVARHAGQGCAFTTRLVVPRHHYDDAVTAAADAMRRVPVGDPTDPATRLRPADLRRDSATGSRVISIWLSPRVVRSPAAAAARPDWTGVTTSSRR